MKVPTKLNQSNARAAYQEKFDEREMWHKLVVKIINWKEGFSDRETNRLTDKISPKEWQEYSMRSLKTNVTYGKEKVLAILEETRKAIKEHGGFS